MKGTTHLAIGVAIGCGAALYYPFTATNAALYVVTAAFSALAADLDGPSVLSSKLGKLARLLRGLVVWSGLLLAGGLAYRYARQQPVEDWLVVVAVSLLLLGFIAREGRIRNLLVSLIGAVLLYVGWLESAGWLLGFGLFVAWAPWLAHRGLTHSVWALAAWTAIGYGLESELQVDGLMVMALYGYLSHLLADSLTPAGVRWLYPLLRFSFRLPR
ncbi:metal-dependent hydrolase [Paenibacillus sp. IB182496]|uniref:Metal-dependent hydrolase n=1 Tax=Paenibacillus sabuli TaxID=2772509 RepID=A0A927BU78_9BACL|nr:metal-dependent hydrolase [Paenibacillus sabuli]MBD2846911.1 metal-dependent hydrolase [Paenibacillus sabuli]